MGTDDSLPDDVTTLQAMLRAERAARLAAEAEAQAGSLLIEKLKLTIKKLRHEQFGQSSERGALLDQLELQLADLEENAAQAETAAQMAAEKIAVPSFERRKPARRPLPEHLPRERIVYPLPATCPCCGDSRLRKIGEDVTETLELVPRQWKVIQHVREKFSCRSCETITRPPAPIPSHRTRSRRSGSAGDACPTVLSPLVSLIEAHVLAAERLHGDETTVPMLAKDKTITGRLWTYVHDGTTLSSLPIVQTERLIPDRP